MDQDQTGSCQGAATFRKFLSVPKPPGDGVLTGKMKFDGCIVLHKDE